ncbi:MAG: anti-sigma factor family protein [Bryobacteraceae bacterium]
MNTPLSTADDHLSNSLLVRFIDDELSSEEAAEAKSHLAQCSSCGHRYAELRRVSSSFDGFLESLQPAFDVSERHRLASKLDRVNVQSISRTASKPGRKLGWWGLAAAAALAVGVLYLPQSSQVRETGKAAVKESASAFEIDGETFVSLPFSNPELPVNARRIVQMQVPLSSLAAAGIVLEPIANQVAQPDRPVIADVLLGLDGQPVAVHVVSFE